MNRANENPPEGDRRANAVAIDAIEASPMLADSPGKFDTFEGDFIATNPRARAIYAGGYERGYVQGQHDGHGDAVHVAELASRTFLAMSATEAHNRAQAADTAKALDVPRFRDRPTPVPSIKPTPTLGQFLDGLRRGGILTEAVAA